jgi:P27 family predicted phage terminase small subunit
MTRPGPKPKPTELKRLTGNPGKRRPPTRITVLPPTDAPPPPPQLAEAGREAWATYWTHGRAWLAPTDRPIITRLCELLDVRAEIAARMASEGLLQVSEDTGRSFGHRLLNDWRGLNRDIAELEDRCGLNPAERSRLGVAEVRVASELDQLISRRAGRG